MSETALCSFLTCLPIPPNINPQLLQNFPRFNLQAQSPHMALKSLTYWTPSAAELTKLPPRDSVWRQIAKPLFRFFFSMCQKILSFSSVVPAKLLPETLSPFILSYSAPDSCRLTLCIQKLSYWRLKVCEKKHICHFHSIIIFHKELHNIYSALESILI